MKKLALTLVMAAVLAGCAAPPTKVGPGESQVGRLALKVDGSWNQMPAMLNVGSATVWTREGLQIDRLLFWSGVKDGEALVPAGPNAQGQRPQLFKATMQPHELVALFESAYSADGSLFTLEKLEPADFAGQKGLRFEFSVARKSDDVRLSGVAWAVVSNSELHALAYTAPRVVFFPRHVGQVEQIARSVRLKT
ncbi:MAG: hypothetical protein AB1430_17255 [Pseudomonadota bacterium]